MAHAERCTPLRTSDKDGAHAHHAASILVNHEADFARGAPAHRAEKWIRFSAVNDALLKSEASN